MRSILGDEMALRGITQNDFEEAFAALLEGAGLPRPEFNSDLSVRGRFLKPDCLWRDARLIVELDGRAAHGTVEAFESDRERDRLLLLDGWRVMRVTWRQVRDEAPEVLADVRGLLAGAVASNL